MPMGERHRLWRDPMHPPPRRSSWLAEVLAAATVLSGVGYLVTAYSISRSLTRPSRGTPRPTPAELGLAFEDVECRTADGHRLVGWAVTPPEPRGTVLLFHGMRFNRAQMLTRMEWLVPAGDPFLGLHPPAPRGSTRRRRSLCHHPNPDLAGGPDFGGGRRARPPRAPVGA